jgi:hypothetical protein
MASVDGAAACEDAMTNPPVAVFRNGPLYSEIYYRPERGYTVFLRYYGSPETDVVEDHISTLKRATEMAKASIKRKRAPRHQRTR